MTRRVFREHPYQRECEFSVTRVVEGGVCLDQTVFYARGGGQPGDRGTLRLADGRELSVVDTTPDPESEDIIHHLAELPADLAPGTTGVAAIDWTRRHRIMRVHTLLHLLCSLVPEPVTGGSIRDDGTGRLDFDIPEPKLDKAGLSECLNRLVEADHPVLTRFIDDSDFDDYPELVRTAAVAPPRQGGAVRVLEIAGVDLQACGGTHVARTGEIGAVTVSKIEKKGRENRRVTVRLEAP